MTIYLEHSAIKPLNHVHALSRFPAGKVGSSLLSIIHSAMDGVIIVDATRRIVLVNRKAENMFGYTSAQLLDKPLEVLMPATLTNEQRRRVDRLSTVHVSGRRSKLDLKGLHADGDHLALKASISRLSVHGEIFMALILHDATTHKPSHHGRQRPVRPSELRRWVASSQQATEVEKRRFSKKLYDDIGQRLSVLKLDLDWLESSLPDGSEGLPARVAQMQGLLDNVITMTKSMASALRPPLLDDFGLLPAIEWMADNFEKKTSVICTVESSGLHLKLDDTIESAVFRIVQEGLSNIERHSHAGNARILLQHAGNQLDVMIQDDGVGMDVGSDGKDGCYGLIAMQERVFALGGTISILNLEPHGVAIHAAIPTDLVFANEPKSLPPNPRL